MANIIIDTNSVRDEIKNFDHYSLAIKDMLDSVNADIRQIEGLGWSGQSSSAFIQKVDRDINLYNKHMSKITEHRDNLESFVEEMDGIISRCNF